MVTFVVAAPLSLALDLSGARSRGVAWSAAEGTLWNGAVRGLSAEGQDFGDITLALRPGELLSGRLGFDWRLAGQAIRANGFVRLGLDGRAHVADASGEVDLARFTRLHERFRAGGGLVRIKVTEADFALGSGCTVGVGEVWSDALTRTGPELGWAGPELRGPIACEAGTLVARASGAAGSDAVEVRAEARPDLTTQVRAEVRTNTPGAGAVLPLVGFTGGAGVWTFVRTDGPGAAAARAAS
jgi:hypothetical protein